MPQDAHEPAATVKTPATLVDVTLAGATTAYAVWLWAHRRAPRPEGTWAKVVFGDALVLAAAALRHRLTGGSYEHAVWWCFVVGGAPIIAGELLQTIERKLEAGEDDGPPPGWD